MYYSLRTGIGVIPIFLQEEKKQDDICYEYQVKYPDGAQIMKTNIVIFLIIKY